MKPLKIERDEIKRAKKLLPKAIFTPRTRLLVMARTALGIKGVINHWGLSPNRFLP